MSVTESERERLGLLVEEMGEVLHIAGKALRHGLDSSHPDYQNVSNAENLAKEITHVKVVLDIMVAAGDIPRLGTQARADKLEKLLKYIHCFQNQKIIKRLIDELDF